MTTAIILGGVALVAIILLVLWMIVKFFKWLFRSEHYGHPGDRKRSSGFWDDLGGFGDGGGDSGGGD